MIFIGGKWIEETIIRRNEFFSHFSGVCVSVSVWLQQKVLLNENLVRPVSFLAVRPLRMEQKLCTVIISHFIHVKR